MRQRIVHIRRFPPPWSVEVTPNCFTVRRRITSYERYGPSPLSIQSRSFLTALSVWVTLRSVFCAAPKPTIQASTYLRGVEMVRDSVPRAA